MGYQFTSTGDRVAFSTRQPDAGTGMLVYNRYDLWVVDTAGGPSRMLVPRAVLEYGLGFSWSPDGRHIRMRNPSDSARGGRRQVRSFARAGCRFTRIRAALVLDDTRLSSLRDNYGAIGLSAVGAQWEPRRAAAARDRCCGPTPHLSGFQQRCYTDRVEEGVFSAADSER